MSDEVVRAPLQDEPPIARQASRGRRSRLSEVLFFAAKLLISAACFWLVFRQVNVRDSLRTLPTIDYRWAAVAVLLVVAQIPLLALRVHAIVRALVRHRTRLTYPAAAAVTAIYALFAQVVPGLVGEGIRAWLLVRHGCNWREGLTTVVIDRSVGVGLLVAFSFVILLLPSPLNSLAGYHDAVLAGFGAALAVGLATLIFAPRIASLLRLWRHSFWIAIVVDDTHRILLGRQGPAILIAACLVHALSVVAVWAVGAALGLSLSAFDCAVLFVVMVGVAVVPISVGGWGLREFAVVSLLGAHGLPPERALLFSLCFGLVFVVVGLFGAIVLLFYPLPGREAPQPA